MLNEIKRRLKYIKTGNLYLCFFTLGMAFSLTGPCLLDLQHMVHTDTQHIAMIYTTRSTGYLFGAIIGGILLDLIRSKQAVFMGCNLFVSLTMFGIPWCTNVDVLMAFMSINGFALGAIETGGNVICLELWGKDSNPFFQGMHFIFSLAGLLSPLIAAPFLENRKELSFNNHNHIDNTTYIEDIFMNSSVNFSNVTSQFSESIPRIIYPFSIVGVVALLVTVLHLAVCIISPTEGEIPKDTTKMNNSERSFLFMFFTVIFTFVLFFVVAGSEIGYAQTLTVFSVKGKLHLTTIQGSYITSAFWAALAVGRLSSAFLSIRISVLKLAIGDICLTAIGALILLFLMPNEWALWLASVIFGVGIAPVFAALVGWLNTHINITNKFSAIFTVGCAAGEMIIPFVITYFIETVPEMFCFVTAAAVIMTSVLLFTLYCMFQKGSKISHTRNTEIKIIDVVSKKN